LDERRKTHSLRSGQADEGSRSLSAVISPDLGLSRVTVTLDDSGIAFPTGETVSWGAIEEIARSETKCFIHDGDGLTEVRVFSDVTGRVCSLYPTGGAPTMVIGGFPMHRIKGTDPHRDTLEKVKAAATITGRVLDTTTGLGYTAIEAARAPTCLGVTSIELDPASLEVARQNPWSQELFTNPKIEQLVGDSYELIRAFPDGTFTRIIHDPPTFSLAGELYSGEFYRQCYRVLARDGRLFHYIGNLESGAGNQVSKGAIRRLKEAGFSRIVPRQQAFGVVAYK
jgi:predicted methyltransferase